MNKNIHFVVGPGRRCLCGLYGGEAIGCKNITDALGAIENDFAEGHHEACLLIAKVFKTLEVNCD